MVLVVMIVAVLWVVVIVVVTVVDVDHRAMIVPGVGPEAAGRERRSGREHKRNSDC
jgi:hypothetical protein